MNHRLTAAALIAATVLTATAITALGVVFDYPDVLDRPAPQILASFQDSHGVVAAWFGVLALGAAAMIPIALGVGRLSSARTVRWSVAVGILAGVVQMIGLLRWPLLVPGYAADATSSDPGVVGAAVESFGTAHRVLGTIVGETFGYLFTAMWTVLVVAGLARSLAGRWFTVLGVVAAGLVLSGVLSPLGLPLVDLATLVGYGLWGCWLVAFAVLLLRGTHRDLPTSRDDRASLALTSREG